MLAAYGASGSSSSTSQRAAPRQPTDAGPVHEGGAGWPALLHGPSHYGASTSTGPRTAHVRWQRNFEGATVAGPVTTERSVAYVASNAGVLHAIRVDTGRDLWRFDGGGSYGSDLSTAPLLLGSGDVIWPGPRRLLFGLGPNGRREWALVGDGDLLTPVLDRPTRLLVVADQTGHISGYRLPNGSGAPIRLWSLQLATSSFGNPVVAADGSIYQTAGDALFAVTSSGRVRWKVVTPSSIETSPAVADGESSCSGQATVASTESAPTGGSGGGRQLEATPMPLRSPLPRTA